MPSLELFTAQAILSPIYAEGVTKAKDGPLYLAIEVPVLCGGRIDASFKKQVTHVRTCT